MDQIVTAAIIGTGQQSNAEVTTDTAVDTLTAQLSAYNRERQLLLTAGAQAIYRQAGQLAHQAPAIPQPSAPELLPVCKPQVAHYINSMLLHQYSELLPEALQRLHKADQRLPFELLPLALTYGTQNKELRTALVYILGERGLWLSQFNPNWSWVIQDCLDAAEGLPANTEIIWQEGSFSQREALLRRLRSTDPATARAWLASIWRQEKAEARTALLSTFENNLSLADEPLLEQALDDRSEGVRTLAASLLTHLPASALSQRLITLADTLLTFSKGIFVVKLPQAFGKTWQRDGLVAKPPRSVGARTWWLTQILARVPVTHWETRFSATPATLITAASESEWSQAILEGWTRSALLHADQPWMVPLWDWWDHALNSGTDFHAAAEIQIALGTHLAQPDAESRILPLLAKDTNWQPALSSLPTPWSEYFSEAFIEQLRDLVCTLDEKSPLMRQSSEMMIIVALSLPKTYIDAALTPWDIPDTKQWYVRTWQQRLKTFTELVTIRKCLIEEITE